MSVQRDVAGKEYWSGEWRGGFDLRPEDERNRGWRNHVTLRFDELFMRFLPQASRAGELTVTEVGCARSRWLPYFARRFGARVGGLDYTENGCEQARAILAASQVDGRIVHGDLFNPPPEMIGASDVVFSWGLVEHFQDTAGVIAALERLVRPGGLLVTIIPNMTGVVGAVQKWMNRKVFDLHVPIDRERLGAATAGLAGELLYLDYFVGSNFWTVNPGKGAEADHGIVKRVGYRLLTFFTVATWLLERGLRIRLPATRLLAPYVVSVWRVAPRAAAKSA
jgi:2-polyprenyl-3-methyl-5-hydroxy-6-metoxy-1,4-benzoquinol methylase